MATPARPKPLANYAPARRAGDFVFVSGAAGRQADGSLAADVGGQTEGTLRNIAATLGDQGCSLTDVVEANVFLVDMADYAAMNAVWNRTFADPARFPARTTVAVRALPQPDLRVEIRAVAWKRA
jgi:2-aminomuconate deaminase